MTTFLKKYLEAFDILNEFGTVNGNSDSVVLFILYLHELFELVTVPHSGF